MGDRALRLLVTGVNGFVGRSLCEKLLQQAYGIRLVSRSANPGFKGVEWVIIDSIDGKTDWNGALPNSDIIIHLAAHVHVMKYSPVDSFAEFHKVNVEGTLNLARQAVRMGVKRFIYISSVKVNGEGTKLGRPYSAEDQPSPVDPYGISKREAEDGLRQLAYETGMEAVIIRPPLIYGPGVKANFLNMMQWLDKGIPLPLGAIRNQRSLVALDNLVDLIITCINHPSAANQIFLAGDGEDLSTPDLLQRLAKALGKKAWLIPVPVPLLTFGAKMVGMPEIAHRLCGSLQVDIAKTRDLLSWNPPVTVDEALSKTAQYYIKHYKCSN